MKKKIIDQIILCMLTYFDEESKISPSISERVHTVYEKIYTIVFKNTTIIDLDKKLIALNNSCDNKILRRQIFNSISETNFSERQIRELIFNLKLLAEFGRILPYEGRAYDKLSESQKLDYQIEQLQKRLQKYKLERKNILTPIAVILPFRIDCKERLRNMYASLISIHRQNIGKNFFSIVVVNQDQNDIYKQELDDYVDKYIFASNSGAYNLAWSRNIGVAHVENAEVVILWDVDVVARPKMIKNIYDSFQRDDIGCVVPYSNAYNLDQKSTSFLVKNIESSNQEVNCLKFIRAQIMCEVYGMVIAVKRVDYCAVGGQDERYEGWGDEDNDFYNRIFLECKVRRLNQDIFHLDHPRPIMRINGEKINKDVILNPMRIGKSMGNIKKYEEDNNEM